jgi:hypothetical protein
MSSINKILNAALSEGLLNEDVDQKEVIIEEGVSDTAVVDKDMKVVKDSDGKSYKVAKENLIPINVAAVGAGLGALALVKKMREKAEVAKKA